AAPRPPSRLDEDPKTAAWKRAPVMIGRCCGSIEKREETSTRPCLRQKPSRVTEVPGRSCRRTRRPRHEASIAPEYSLLDGIPGLSTGRRPRLAYVWGGRALRAVAPRS